MSPNLDEITNTEPVDDSSIDESTLSDSGDGPRPRDAARARAGVGYVNLSSIYALGDDKWNAQNAPVVKNGLPDKRLPEKPVPPEKPVSLLMMNGKTENRCGGLGNDSFLYSQVSGGARARDPPPYSTAAGEATSPVKPALGSPVNGLNKISDNYERAIAQRLSPQSELARVNRVGPFGKVSAGRRGARDHDDCAV